jgi:TP901 family phage tail tape measure protein
MARTDGIKVHVYGDYDNKQIDKAIRDLKTLKDSGEGLGSAMAVQGAKFQSFGAATAAVGASLTKGLTLPIVGIGAAALLTGAEFEKSMNKVKAISGATGSDFEALKQQAKDLGRTTGWSASQAAEAMSFLAMAGFKTTEILGAMPGTLNLATAGNLDLARAADISSNILTGYRMEVGQLDHAVDVLAKTFTSTNTDLEQLGEAFKYAGPVASSAGVQFEEAAAAIGMMGNAGIQGSMAGTSLRGAISRLLNPTTQVTAALDKLGIKVTDSSGKLLPLDEIVQQLGDSGATTGDYMTIFGQRAGPAMAALVSQGADSLRNLTSTLEQSGGTAENIAKTQFEGFTGAMITLKSAFEAAMIAIAESGLLERGTALVQGLVDVVATFAQWVEKLPKPVKNMAFTIGLVAAVVGPLIWAFGKIVGVIGLVMVKMALANTKVVSLATTIRGLGTVTTTTAAQVGTGFGAIGASAVMSMGVVSRAVSLGIGAVRGFGLAIKGLLTSLGPIGIAIIALGTAYTVLSGRAAAAEAKVAGLRDAILQTGEAGKVAVLDQIIKDLQELEMGFLWIKNNAADSLAEIGIGLDDAAIAISGSNVEFDAFIRKVTEAGQASGMGRDRLAELVNMLNSQRDALTQATSEAGRAKTATDATSSAARKLGIDSGTAAGLLDGMGDSLDGVADEAGEATDEVKKLSDMFSTFDANVNAIRARDSFRSYMREFGEALAKGNRDLLGNSKAAEKNRDAITNVFEKKKAEVLAWAEANGKGQEDVDKKWSTFTSRFAGRLKAEGFKAKDIEAFLGAGNLNVASVNVQGQLDSTVTGMANATRPKALSEFTKVGTAVTTGMSNGIRQGKGAVVDTARRLAADAATAARSELGIESPSKVFISIGRDVVNGYIQGISEKGADARKAARAAMVQSVKDAIKRGMDELKAQLETARNYALGWRGRMLELLNLGSAFAAAQDKDRAKDEAHKIFTEAAEALAEARADLDAADTDEARAAAQKRVDAQIKVLNSAETAYRTAANAAATSWVDEFRDQLTKASNFAALLQQLKNAGAHEMLVNQVAAAGVDAGTQMAHDLINGGASGTGGLIDQFNTDFVTFDTQVTNLGVDFANAWALAVGPKMGHLTAAQTLAAFRKEFGKDGEGRARLMAIMDRLAASMSRTARITVVVDQVAGSRVNIDGARADGGRVWPGGTFLVGEQGPELFQPSSAGTIIPNNQLAGTRVSGSSSTGGTTINLTVNAGMGTQGAEVGRQIVDALKAYERRNGAVYVAA